MGNDDELPCTIHQYANSENSSRGT